MSNLFILIANWTIGMAIMIYEFGADHFERPYVIGAALCIMSAPIWSSSGEIIKRFENWTIDPEEEKPEGTKPEPMSDREFSAFVGWGEMPERLWPEEIEKLRQQFYEDFESDDRSVCLMATKNLEDALDDMMGITRLEQKNKLAIDQGGKTKGRK